MKQYDVISFDLDGTLVPGNSWLAINTKLGMTAAQDAELYDLFMAGTITYTEWLDRIYTAWTRNNPGLTVFDALEDLNIPLYPGARELLAWCRAESGALVVVTGALDIVAEHIVGEYVDAVLATNEAETDDEGKILELIDVYDETNNGKLAVLAEYCADRDIPMDRVLHIGDGEYDIPVFQAVGGSITFDRCKPAVRAAAQHVVGSIADIKKILEA